MDAKSRQAIISAYGKALQNRAYSCGKESDLPYPKNIIRQANAEELLMGNLDEKEHNAFEVGFIELESFIPDEEFKPIKAWEDNLRKGQEMIKEKPPGKIDQKNLVDELAKMISKMPFPEDTNKRVLERMYKRLEQIQAIKILAEIWKE
mgnify:CR=1 FL=1